MGSASRPDSMKQFIIEAMGAETLEALVIVQPGADERTLRRLREVVTVEQAAAPRLAVIRADEEGIRAVQKLRGISGVYLDDVPSAERARLGPTERLFIDAWELRKRPKLHRKGEGLPWDAPGFLPPDPPREGRQ